MKNVFSWLRVHRAESANPASDGPAAARPDTKPITASPSPSVVAGAKKPRLPPELIREVALHYVDKVRTEADIRALFASRYVSHVWKHAVDSATDSGFSTHLGNVAAEDALAGLVVPTPVEKRRLFPYFNAATKSTPPCPEQHAESHLIDKYGSIKNWERALTKTKSLALPVRGDLVGGRQRRINAQWAFDTQPATSSQQITRILNATSQLRKLYLTEFHSQQLLDILQRASLPSTLRCIFIANGGQTGGLVASVQWTRFSQLRTLYLEDCSIGHLNSNWSLHVADMQLEELSLERNRFVIADAHTAWKGVVLPQVPLERLPALKKFSLAGNELEEKFVEPARRQLQGRTRALIRLTYDDPLLDEGDDA